MIDRRRFLRVLAGAGVLGAGAAGGLYLYRRRPIPGAPIVEDRPGMADATATVSARRRLGRTGLEISVVGIGAGGLKGPELIIGTKWDAGAGDSKAEILASLDKSLGRLGVDHVDIMQLHWLGGGHKIPDNGLNRLDNPELYLAMEEAKKAGKVRFFGATSHHADRAKILAHAIDKGAFDMLLVKMNVLDFADAGLPALLAKAKQKDIGVVVMKSQPGGDRIPEGYAKSRYSIFQANLRWVLEQEAVTSVVHSKIGTDESAQDLAAGAVKEKLGAEDRALLEEYAVALSPEYCRGCGDACTAACPTGVAIPHVLQFSMYDREYGWHDRARTHYAELPPDERWSDACLSCSACSSACPHGVDAAAGVREAKRRLG
ncbi:MAG: hypothetical protein DYH12_16880 [Sorangiineae bacterium PRO1]|nr:hypothetical protein [Sorangiineae bacterium PRO1]